MSSPTFKKCQHCDTGFECKAGNIAQCQCFSIQLTAEQKAFLEKEFNDCLCINCLLQLKDELEHKKKK